MQAVSLEYARKNNLKHYFTGKPCKWGHVSKRYTRNGTCCECNASKAKIWRFENRAHVEKYRKINRDRDKRRNKVWREKNKVRLSRNYKNWRKTEEGQLRVLCNRVFARLSVGKDYKSKLDLLEYSCQEFSDYLLSELPQFCNLFEAYDAGYHKDHIVPVSFIIKHISDKDLAFKVAMDLKNLQLIHKRKNWHKSAKINIPLVQSTMDYLWEKYNVNT